MQCLEKEPAARPSSAQEILQRLETTTAPATGLERLTNRLTRRQRWSVLGATAIVLVAAVAVPARAWLAGRSDAVRVESLAIIPFLNVGGDTAQEYLAEGMANELTTALGKVAGIRVVSRTLSARYRDRSDLDAKEIGQTLEVRYVLHGTVRRTADQLTVSAQLISATDNSEAWSEDFTSAPTEAFAVQDYITRAIGHTLQRHLGGAVASVGISPAASIGTRNSQAYDLYLRGKRLLERRGPGVALAIEKFEQAIGEDSNFARAHAGLGVALELLPYFSPVDQSRCGSGLSAPHAARSYSTARSRRHIPRSDSPIATPMNGRRRSMRTAVRWHWTRRTHRRACSTAVCFTTWGASQQRRWSSTAPERSIHSPRSRRPGRAMS
jgi:TolB-like protein